MESSSAPAVSRLSRRAVPLLQGAGFLIKAFEKCAMNPYHRELNPNGTINLGTAQNHLMFDLIEPYLNAPRHIDRSVPDYNFLYGSIPLRLVFARLMAIDLSIGPLQSPSQSTEEYLSYLANHLVLSTGTSAILDSITYAICDEGEGMLVPTPYYGGFTVDLGLRSRARVVPVPLEPETGFLLTTKALEESLSSSSIPIKALLLTHPNNPLGFCLRKEELMDALRFARDHNLEVVSDEIYAGSVYGPETEFLSARRLCDLEPELACMKDRVHTVYGLSKDFAMNGFRVGALLTDNDELNSAMRALCMFPSISTDTQHLLQSMLSNPEAVKAITDENKRRLAHAFETLKSELDRFDIKLVTRTSPVDGKEELPNAGFFVVLDLKRALQDSSEEAEIELYERLLAAGVYIVPTKVVGENKEAGWFRLCFAESDELLKESVKRIASVTNF